jgi:hypothetical protein
MTMLWFVCALGLQQHIVKNCLVLFDEKIREKGVHCIFYWWGCTSFCLLLMTVQSLVSMAEGGGKLPAMICGEG